MRKDTFFRLNRFYLLFSVLVSELVPLVPVNISVSQPIIPVLDYVQKVMVTPVEIRQVSGSDLHYYEIITWLYIAGTLFFLAVFLFRIINFLRVVRNHTLIRKEGLNVVLMKSAYAPFSFFNIVFINEDLYNSHDDLSAILSHERIHASQFHTIDILIIEACKIFQWFNPFIWFLERSMKNNHEFIADQSVISGGVEKSAYQELLFSQVTGMKFSSLANNLNHSP
jgi:beta-lactamase regulating signal transducer with metallopeptidase domain